MTARRRGQRFENFEEAPSRPEDVTSSRDPARPLKVAWFPYFPVEWLPDPPAELRDLPRQHPATWQRVLWEQFRRDDKVRLEVIVPRGQFPRSFSFQRDGTTFHCIRTLSGGRGASLYWLDTLLIARILKRIQPDLVHAWGTEFGGAAIAGRLPYPALVTMQGILTWYGSVFPLSRHQKISRWLEPRSLRKAKVITCESSFGMKYLHERYPRARLLQVEHAPHPMFSRIVRAPQIQPPLILCVGSFLKWKGADLVIEALAGIEGTRLLWVGSKNPALENELRTHIPAHVWPRISFEHDLPAEEVAIRLKTATLFVHAARVDNSPNSVKEAVVAGVPVIATDTGGIPDYVLPGRNGLLFRSGDAADCRAKIVEALQHPLFSQGIVEIEALRDMRLYLSAETMAKKFYEAYQVVLGMTDRR